MSATRPPGADDLGGIVTDANAMARPPAAVRHVVAAEGSAEVRNLIDVVLSAAGYRVTVVPTTTRALQLCHAEAHADALVIDVSATLDLADTIRTARRAHPDLAVLVLWSGAKGAGLVPRENRLGVISKPFTSRDLLTVLSALLTPNGG